MYRCRDCAKEFKEKIEYCDCGNNTFDYIEDVAVMQKPAKKPLTLEQKGELISQIFFVVCLVMSLIVWLIPVKTQTAKQETKVQKNETTIPDINKIWDDTPVRVVKNETPIPLPLDIMREDLPESKIIPKTEQKIVQKPVQPAQNKQQTQNKTVQPVQKPVQSQPKTTKPAQQKPVEKTVQPKVEQPKTETPKVVEQPKVSEPQKPIYNPNSPEMLKYKGNLRAALFSKFAVGSVQGSGSCEIQFSVDSSGKLINRKFSKESSNKSLNDAVYYMLMSVPKYSTPPSGYNGETIKMNFTINNDGSYAISIH